jgi:hypothetical protein
MVGKMAEDVERRNLEILYKNYHDENWQRGHGIWLVNSILVTGSLIIAFQPTLMGFSIPLVSLFLVIIADILHATTERVTIITYNKMREIENRLNMNDLGELAPRRMFETQIKGRWWYLIRSLASYILYAFLSGIFLLLISNNLWLSISIFVIIFGFHSVITIRSLTRQ